MNFLKSTLLFPILLFISLISNSQSTSLFYGGTSLHAMYLNNSSKLISWGNNSVGQLGDSTVINRKTPVFVKTINSWNYVACGSAFTFALKTDSTLWAWGDNSWGQLGLGNTTTKIVPVQISSEHWKSVACGTQYTSAIKSDGTLWAWGRNGFGELGDGTVVYKFSPVQVGTATNWVKIVCGSVHTVGLKADGTIWAWGNNSYGQLGDGTTVNKTSPVQIGSANDWVGISCGNGSTAAIKANGTLWTWGYNSYGQLGDGTTVNKTSPVQVGSANNWLSISQGGGHTVGLKTDGTIWSWGANLSGQLGDNSYTSRNVPTQINNFTWQSIVAGDQFTVAIKSDGTVWSTGSNYYSQLGVGSLAQNIPIFTQVSFAALPVTLGNFSVSMLNKKIYLKWESTLEINNKEFEIQKSIDGFTYETIGIVLAKGSMSNYSFIDVNPFKGINYYRLKQIDKDDRFSFSEVKKINVNYQLSTFNIAPNPASSFTRIYFNDEIKTTEINVFDVLGNIVLSQNLNGSAILSYQLNTDKLLPGIYIVSIKSGSNISTEKLIISR